MIEMCHHPRATVFYVSQRTGMEDRPCPLCELRARLEVLEFENRRLTEETMAARGNLIAAERELAQLRGASQEKSDAT